MGLAERIVSTREVFAGKFIRVRVDSVRHPDGQSSEMEVVERAGAAAVVPVREGGQVVLVRQPRQAAGKELLELPAGLLNDGEDPAECAARELSEELGLEAGGLDPLTGYFSSAGFTDEFVHIFLGREVRRLGEPHLDPGEEVEAVELDLGRAVSMAVTGEIQDAKTVIGLLLARERLTVTK